MSTEEPWGGNKVLAIFDMAKSSALARSRMNLETLLYHLHKARDNWAYVSQSEVGLAYKDTLVWKIAQKLPGKYESEIRERNNELCFQARQDTFKKAGLL